LAGGGALSGATSITFAANATADIPSGQMVGTTAITFNGSATLDGLAELIGSSEIRFDAFGTIDQPLNILPGPLDSPRIAEGLYRRKKKKLRRIEEPESPVFISPASFERAPPQEVIDKVPNFATLAKTVGTDPAVLSAQIDREIEFLMREEAERDDEEALVLILTALD